MTFVSDCNLNWAKPAISPCALSKQSLLKNILLQDGCAAVICQGTLRNLVPIHSPVRMQDYKKRQLTRVGCTRAQRSWFPLRRSLSMCQRDSRHPRPPLLEQIHALYGCTGHVYNAASKEQTQKRWDHCRTSHCSLLAIKSTNYSDEEWCWYTDTMTIQDVLCFTQNLCQASKWSIINLIYLNFNPWWLHNRFFFYAEIFSEDPFHTIHVNFFNANKLYGAKRRATALFRHQTARRSSLVMQC